jgi:hypothetical protein
MLVTRTYVSARRAVRTHTDLPSWSCGFDSRRPLSQVNDLIRWLFLTVKSCVPCRVPVACPMYGTWYQPAALPWRP